jgi:hypothetical protein
MNSHGRSPFKGLAAAHMRVGCELPGRKLTALRYGSVSAIGNRVTDVTGERSAGTRQRQQGKKVQQKSQQMT